MGILWFPRCSRARARRSAERCSTHNRFRPRNEVAPWQQALSNGLSRSAVVQEFLNSDEYHKRIVDQFYIEFLLRPPDAAGEEGWVTFLRTGGTIETTAEMFLASDEYVNRLH